MVCDDSTGNVVAPPGQPELASDEQWLRTFDIQEFEKDIKLIGSTLAKNQGEDDVKHLNKIIRWNRLFALVGFSTVWMTPNPFTIFCVSTAIFSSWTMLGHHVCHGGYDRTAAAEKGYSRFKFAIGGIHRRLMDWFDWMVPEAWNAEHNLLHHWHLNELTDPDLVERNVETLRRAPVPRFLKYIVVAFFAGTWKWIYYAPNTYNQLQFAKWRKKNGGVTKEEEEWNLNHSYTLVSLSRSPPWISFPRVMAEVFLPYMALHFVVPALFFFYTMGETAFYNCLINLVLADVLTNAHSFLMIVTNHAGNDMYYFSTPCRPKSGMFYLRQILGSANFTTGGDVVDFTHGWLNYQVEHHLFPDLSMLSYQRAQPLVKAVCDKHGVPYIQENVFIRLKKTVDIMVGATDMRRFPTKSL